MTLKERFDAKFPLADYEAVYARLMRDNKEGYEKARNLEKVSVPHYPFSCLEKADKTYIANTSIRFIVNNYESSYLIGFDIDKDSLYVYKPKLMFLYNSLEEYVEMLIERLIA